MNPLVSIVIPAFNAANTLDATLRSVFHQNFQDFEIIIVDDGSEDETVNIAGSTGDTRVTIITQTNAGASAARNTGIRAAAGKYIAFLDADDLWLPQKLELQLALLVSKCDLTAVHCGALWVDNELNILSSQPSVLSKDALLDALLFKNTSPWMSTLLVDRRIFEVIGFFDEELGMIEDWEFMLRLVRHCKLINVEEPLALYRQYPGNRSKDWKKHIGPGLIILNRQFSDPKLPSHIKARKALVYSTFYTMISGGAFYNGDIANAVKWGFKAVFTNPLSLIQIVSMPLRKLRRSSGKTSLSF